MNNALSQRITESENARRLFLKKLAATGLLVGMQPLLKNAQAEIARNDAPALTGPEFHLTIAETPVNFSGTPRRAITVNGSLPAPTLHWREGETITLHVTNHLTETTSIHWHGIILPFEMDGVPGISFEGIAPGKSFTYRFTVQQSGTYWYHSHSGMQEQSGLYGAIVIEPKMPEPFSFDKDYVVVLSDWTDEQPEQVFAKLKKQSDYYNFNQPTVIDFFRDVVDQGLSEALSARHMWNMMRMNKTDLADISAYTYHYLLNGSVPKNSWTGLFKPGGKVRLRFINAAAQSLFDVRIPGLKLQVVLADGQPVEPVWVDEFRMGVAETYDVIVSPESEVYSIFAQSMDRTGFSLGFLATRQGLKAAVPELDKPEPLSMLDMMGGMNHAEHAEHIGMHSQPFAAVRHASSEFGANVDMRVDTPRVNLDDPGVGLRNNGRKVLSYADLHSRSVPVRLRKPDRELELHLTGNMERYIWSIDGLEYSKVTPVHFRHGECLRVVLVNDTMMTHPMHLHGMWCDLENPEGEFQVRKHTLMVQPAQRLSFLIDVDASGKWAWHCHLFYHMHAGMMREVVVS